MSKTKDYLFKINHPCTWVKGDGSGLPRAKEYSLVLQDYKYIFEPTNIGVYVNDVLYPSWVARSLYKELKNIGYKLI